MNNIQSIRMLQGKIRHPKRATVPFMENMETSFATSTVEIVKSIIEWSALTETKTGNHFFIQTHSHFLSQSY